MSDFLHIAYSNFQQCAPKTQNPSLLVMDFVFFLDKFRQIMIVLDSKSIYLRGKTMKRKLLMIVVAVVALMCAMAVLASAETYYVDRSGAIVDSTSDRIAYEYDLIGSAIQNVYLYDTTITKIIIPDMPSFTGSVQLQKDYTASLGVYAIEDKDTKASNLMSQITEVEVHEDIYLDGAYSMGVFAGFSSLESLSFYGKVSAANKGGFFQGCTSLSELHFYGQNLAIPSVLINNMKKYDAPAIIMFHESASGTISTGGDTLPTVASLGNKFTIIINPNITPSNPSDPRLGAKWGGITATTGWELIMACNPSLYTQDGLNALKTSHGFCSRANDLASATVKEATVMSYCDALYDGTHNLQEDDGSCETAISCTRCKKTITEAKSHALNTYITYENGFDADGRKICDCTNDGCTVLDSEAVAPAFFKCLGYSVPEENRYDGLYVAFSVSNIGAYTEYVSVMGEFKYGIAIANANGVGELISLDGDECVLSADKGLYADMTGSEYTVFKLSIMGFSESVADTLNLVIAAYASADYDADGTSEVKFVQHSLKNEPNNAVNGFNTVTLDRAYYNLYPDKRKENA